MANAFDMLHPVLRAALKRHGYSTPTPVQEMTIPHLLRGRNALVIAPTGSGKTEAALLPVMSRLLGTRSEGVKAVYITPLRSLNRDVFKRMSSLASSVGLRLDVRHGDSTKSEKRRFLLSPPDIVVMTPETFYFMLSVERFREAMRSLRYVIVDEVHELFSSKRGAEFALALERAERWYTRSRLQIVGLSATVEDPLLLARRLFSWRSFIVIDAAQEKKLEIVVDAVDSNGRALRIVRHVESAAGPVLVFTNTRDTAEIVGVELKTVLGEDKVLVHHGSLSRDVRLEAENALKKGLVKAVVATSSLELGIDVGHVDLVIQYMSPRQAMKLVQRAGRSGHRFGRASRAVIVAENNLFDILEAAVLAARAMRGELEPLPGIEHSLDALVHQVVGMVIEKGELSIGEIVEIVSSTSLYGEYAWDLVEKAVAIAEATRLLRRTGDVLRPGSRAKSYYYTTTMIPDTEQYSVVDIESGRKIGVLDEEFVVTLEKGSLFVLSARLWEVVSVEDSVVRVKPRRDRDVIPPSWEGDLIPVEWKVAREVGSILRRFETIGARVLEAYPLTAAARARVTRVLESHLRSGAPMPSDKRLVAEIVGDTLLLYSFLGSRGNRAFEYLLAAYLEETLGYPPRTGSTPYVVFVKLASREHALAAARALRNIERLPPSEVAALIEKAARRSNLYKWILLHVARRSGAVPRDLQRRPASLRGLLAKLSETPLGEEALRELYATKLDLEPLTQLVRGLRSGRIELKVYMSAALSPLGTEAVGEARFGERLSPEKMPANVIAEIVKRKLSKRKLYLLCISCGNIHEAELGRLPEKPRCPRCGATMLAAFSREEEAREALSLLRRAKRRERLSRREKEKLKELYERAYIAAEYGKKGLEALASTGVGTATARRVLRALVFGEERFYTELVKAEAQYHIYKRRLEKQGRASPSSTP